MEVIRETFEASGSRDDVGGEKTNGGFSGEFGTPLRKGPSNGITHAHSSAIESSPVDPWRRTVSRLSMNSLWGTLGDVAGAGTTTNLCHVDVVAGGTEGSFLDRHQIYLITIASAPGQRVSRRYRDFSWLREALVHRYPFRIVPQIPGKHGLGPRWLASENFMASRRRGLEEFLFLVINHPVLQKDTLVLDFLGVKDYEEVRGRALPVWQEEVNVEDPSSPEGGPSSPPIQIPQILGDSSWEAYSDAQDWIGTLKSALLSLKQHLNEMMDLSIRNSKLLVVSAEAVQLLLQNTQLPPRSEKSEDGVLISNLVPAQKVADVFRSLSNPHAYLADSLERDALRLELFQRLVEMINRTRKLKFDRFGWLSDKIIMAQATAEKLRLRDGNVMTPELERALARVHQYQRELYYQSKRNEFADSCLRQELGWMVRIFICLPEFFTELQATFHQNHRLAMELTSRPSSNSPLQANE